jgi:hypothetical protein
MTIDKEPPEVEQMDREHEAYAMTQDKPKPLEMQVKHVRIHALAGNCPACGKEALQFSQAAIAAHDAGTVVNGQCPCGQALTIPGKAPESLIITLGTMDNRHARRSRGK